MFNPHGKQVTTMLRRERAPVAPVATIVMCCGLPRRTFLDLVGHVHFCEVGTLKNMEE